MDDNYNPCLIGKEIKFNITFPTCTPEESNADNPENNLENVINSTLTNTTADNYDKNCTNESQEISSCLCPKTNTRCDAVTNDVICKFTSVSLSELNYFSSTLMI